MRTVRQSFILAVALAALLAWSPAVWAGWIVSCEGTMCADGGIYDYQYSLKNLSADAQDISEFWVAALTSHIAVALMPSGWNFAVVSSTDGLSAETITPHGNVVDPLASPRGAWGIVKFWGDPITVDPNQDVTFAFRSPLNPKDANWAANGAILTNWGSNVAGPLGTYTDGPVHTPCPEPATLSLLALGGLALLRRRQRASL